VFLVQRSHLMTETGGTRTRSTLPAPLAPSAATEAATTARIASGPSASTSHIYFAISGTFREMYPSILIYS
jgi:hypothetical protein